MRSIAILIPRLIVGGLLAGHGAQKLFGSFGGRGLPGTAGWLESLGLRPGDRWANVAGWSEFGGGVLTALGFLNPIGPIVAGGAMLMAWLKVHLGRPVWNTEGGPELPLTNLAALSAITLAGPGRVSIDGLLGIRVSRFLALGMLGAVAAAIGMGARREVETAVEPFLEGLGMGGSEPGVSDPAMTDEDLFLSNESVPVPPTVIVTSDGDVQPQR